MERNELSTESQYRLVYDAICAIAAHCDGAISQDGVGFNGSDTKFGRRIALIDFEDWTDDIKVEAARILGNTYRVQAQEWTGVDARELSVVREAAEVYTNHAARQQARDAERNRTAQSQRFVKLFGNSLIYTYPYDAEIKDAFKDAGPFRWDAGNKTWRIDVDKLNKNVVGLTIKYGFNLTDEADAVLEAAAEVEAVTGTVELKGDYLLVTLIAKLGGEKFSSYRNLDGYSWIGGSNQSTVDPTPRNIAWLTEQGFVVPTDITPQISARQIEADERLEASRSADSDLDLSDCVPAGLEPYPFQIAGVEYALKARRTFIADEMGLGKTVQAILAVQVAQTLPVVVVCPASLKGNWAREIGRWAPERTVEILSGRNPHGLDADFTIVNYDILDAWTDKLISTRPQGLVVDESHYAKNPKAKRTLSVIKLAAAVPQSGLVLALTGTPILNRPVELVTQLQILGRLEDVAPKPRRGNDDKAWSFSFKFRYCGPENPTGHGWIFNGVSNADELNRKLRAACFVRRERADVLDLKATNRVRIPLSLNGELNDYRRAEQDVIRFIRDEFGSDAARRAQRAEVLVQLNKLRLLAEVAKIPATIEWIEDWLESYPTKSLVVFSEHVEVQKALAAHFSCPTILGGQKDVEGQKALFQSGQSRIIVCSLQAAREGHTLTAASDVVFTGLGWTPGGLQQAEDRCNRIGQEADKVVAWQLLASDTIDEEIAELIATKQSTFDAVVRGDGNDDDTDIVNSVIDFLGRK